VSVLKVIPSTNSWRRRETRAEVIHTKDLHTYEQIWNELLPKFMASLSSEERVRKDV